MPYNISKESLTSIFLLLQSDWGSEEGSEPPIGLSADQATKWEEAKKQSGAEGQTFIDLAVHPQVSTKVPDCWTATLAGSWRKIMLTLEF